MTRHPLGPILLILFGIVVGLAGVELTLALLDMPVFGCYRKVSCQGDMMFFSRSPGSRMLHRYEPHARCTMVYEDNPRNYFDSHNSVTIQYNSKGFRGPDLRPGEVPDTRRIVFLGDSFTLGEGVKLADTFAEKTAFLLNRSAYGQSKRVHVKSYNYSIVAYNTSQEYRLFLQEVLPLSPDLVVLGYFLNDAAGPYFRRDPRTGKIKADSLNPFWYGIGKRPPDTLLYAFRLSRLIWKAVYQHKVSERTLGYYRDLYSLHNPDWTRNRRDLQALIRACERHRIPLIVVCFPVLFQLNDRYPFKYIHEIVGTSVVQVARTRTHFLDMFPHFKGKDPRELWVHVSDHHPNERAHLIVAERLAELITRQDLLN